MLSLQGMAYAITTMADEEQHLGEGWEDWIAFYEEERPRGILTKNDREYLRGEKDIEGQNERNTRYRIRKRLRNGLLDLAFLNAEFKGYENDWDQISDDTEVSKRRVQMLGTLYSLYIFGESETNEGLIENFESDLESMLQQEHPYQGMGILSRSVSVNIDIEDTGKQLEDIEESIRQENVTLQEASFYAEFGEDEELIRKATNIIDEHKDQLG